MNFFTISGILLTTTSLLTGIFVIVQDPKKKINRLWMLFCITSMAIGIVIYYRAGNIVSNHIITYDQILIIILSCNGLILFNFIKTLTNYKIKRILILLYIASFIFIIINSISIIITLLNFYNLTFASVFLEKILTKLNFPTSYFMSGSIELKIFFSYYFAIILATTLLSVKFFWKTIREQQTSRLIIIGLFSWLLGISSIILLTDNINTNGLISILLSLSVSIMGCTIIIYYASDHSYIIRKTIIYITPTILIATIFTTVSILEQKISFFHFNQYYILLLILISLSASFIIKPLQEYLIKFTDKMFSKKTPDYQHILNQVNRAIANSIEYSNILKLTTSFLVNTIGIEKIYLINYNKHLYNFFEISNNKNNWSLKKSNPLIKLLSKIQTPIIIDDIENWLSHDEFKQDLIKIKISIFDLQTIKQEMKRKKIIAVLPFITKKKLIGFMAIGKKKSGEPYNNNDIKILNNISNQLAISLENAKLYQELKKTEKIIRKEHGINQSIITNLLDGLIVIDQNQNIISANPMAQKLFPKKRLIDQSLPEILSKDIDINNISEAKFPIISEVILENPNKIIIEMTTTILKQNEEKIGYIKILHDITRDKEIDKIKTDFIRTAAHKLRTPLSATKWVLQMIIEGDLGEITSKQKIFLEKGYHANEKMVLVVNELLNVSEIEEGKFKFHFQQIQITKTTDEVIQELSSLAKERSQKIIYTQDKYVAKINGDPQKIYSVIKTLILNAIQYTLPEGTIKIKIENFLGKEIKFTIIDNGVGVPKTQQNKLFTKFMRGDNIIQMEQDGNGLGLYIAKYIIKAHKGKLSFEENSKKQGSTFYFTIPSIID